MTSGATLEDRVNYLTMIGFRLNEGSRTELEARYRSAPNFTIPARKVAGVQRNQIRRGTPSTVRSNPDRPSMQLSGIAQTTSSTIGRSTIHGLNPSVSVTSNRIGNTTHHNFSNGLSGTTTQVGNLGLHNFSDGLSGTTNGSGAVDFHNFSNGVSGTTIHSGSVDFHNYSDGTSCTTMKLGQFSTTHCQ